MITGRPTCFHRFYIDVSHPKWLLLEVHRYEVEVAQDSRLDSFMSLQHLVSSSLWCSYFLSTLIGSREVTCFWWRSWICHVYKWSLCTAPGAPPGGLSIARIVVSQQSFLRHFPAKQGNPCRNDDILEALADFGIEALLGWALIDFPSVSSFSIIWKEREKWMSTFALSKQKQYPNWKLQWRWMKYCISSRLLDAIILSYIQIFKIVLTKVSLHLQRKGLTPDSRPRAARRKLLWRRCCGNLSEGRKLLGPIWLEQKPWLKMSGTGYGSCEQICS